MATPPILNIENSIGPGVVCKFRVTKDDSLCRVHSLEAAIDPVFTDSNFVRIVDTRRFGVE
ncbi:MAG: hypothetical protein AAGK70_17270, partial [Pseudomonadota bacterium]